MAFHSDSCSYNTEVELVPGRTFPVVAAVIEHAIKHADQHVHTHTHTEDLHHTSSVPHRADTLSPSPEPLSALNGILMFNNPPPQPSPRYTSPLARILAVKHSLGTPPSSYSAAARQHWQETAVAVVRVCEWCIKQRPGVDRKINELMLSQPCGRGGYTSNMCVCITL